MELSDRNASVELDIEDTYVPAYSLNLAELSRTVMRRVRAVKKNQLEVIDLETKFNQRVHELNKEFEPLFNTAFMKRKALVMGEHEPSDNECDVPLIHALTPEALKTIEENAPADASPSKGVPDFWLQAMYNTFTLGSLIEEHDAEILKYISDITYQSHVNPNGFTLFFHFEENPFFADRILKKEYEIQIAPEKDDPFSYDGPMVTKCMGCPIHWYDGKDVTKLEVKDDDTGKKVPVNTFFKFFDEKPQQLSKDNEDGVNEATADDFNVGLFIRDELIPRAVLYFTGEKEDDYDEEESTDSGDDEFVEKDDHAKMETMEE
ncbi:nucleosome assembly protein (NAP) domain-containing protein [Ditylenchus destructor]|uniref:Nucleosome assembly protein (NAP) domain-containing protein n=1 Tax=Ditylenchus destructor TaxID=166010 RepID=A0AAD4NC60_9BILA|nr:nucleosome assembly protein (NAP) domain-containing protein [Ditylenchus destructor]